MASYILTKRGYGKGMISNGWRIKTRKVVKNTDVYIHNGEVTADSTMADIITKEFISRSETKKKTSKYIAISISKATNYDFTNCNVYVEGLDNCPESFSIAMCIRNCTFTNCTIISCYEENMQFRYCKFNKCTMELEVQHIDFSQCTIDNVNIISSGDDDTNNTIESELSFNCNFDTRCITKVDNMSIKGKVNWVWIHNNTMISIKKLEFKTKQTLNIACLNGDYLFKAFNGKLITVAGDDYTIHDYAEEYDTI